MSSQNVDEDTLFRLLQGQSPLQLIPSPLPSFQDIADLLQDSSTARWDHRHANMPARQFTDHHIPPPLEQSRPAGGSGGSELRLLPSPRRLAGSLSLGNTAATATPADTATVGNDRCGPGLL